MRDYVSQTEPPAQDLSLSQFEPAFEASVVVMPTPHAASWNAVWAIDAHGTHEEFTGLRDDAVTWAQARCQVVWCWSEELADVRLL